METWIHTWRWVRDTDCQSWEDKQSLWVAYPLARRGHIWTIFIFSIYNIMIKPGLAFHPWEYLADALEAKWWSQKQLSEIIGISKFEVNDIIKWRRNITPRIAYRLWEAFWNSWESWLKLQSIYDLYVLDHNKEEVAAKNQIRARVRELEFA